MHELSITQSIIELISEQANGQKVHHIVLEIGQLSAILPDAIRFCFDICAQGTVAEAAHLTIQEVAGKGQCRDCQHILILTEPFGLCDRCGSPHLNIIQGQELKIKAMEIESLCV